MILLISRKALVSVHLLGTENGGLGSFLLDACTIDRGANHSEEISYILCENPIVLSENPWKSFYFREKLVRYLQE